MKNNWTKKISNCVTWIVCIILGIILLINLSIIIQAKTNKDKVPSVFGYKPFIVLSQSMETQIHKGDLIIVKTVNPDTLVENDIIAFQDSQGTVTTHRIINIVERNGETYFVTKGDNNDSQDQNLVEKTDVEGIYLFRIGGLGNVFKSLSEPTTIIIIILGITIIFGVAFYMSNKKDDEIERQEFLAYKKQKELEELKEFEEFKKQKEMKEKKQTGKKDEKVAKTTKASKPKETPKASDASKKSSSKTSKKTK